MWPSSFPFVGLATLFVRILKHRWGRIPKNIKAPVQQTNQGAKPNERYLKNETRKCITSTLDETDTKIVIPLSGDITVIR
jgi:hypothetical protein